MKYKDVEYNTIGDVFEAALSFARKSPGEADNFFKAYINHIMNVNKISFEEAAQIAKSNLGYFAGYYGKEVCDIIYKTYQCSHPIFGKEPYAVSPEGLCRWIWFGEKINKW